MNTRETNLSRLPRKIKLLPETVEMGIPLDINGSISEDIYNRIIFMSEDVNDCFGKDFDIRQNDCAGCADNEVCGIIFGNAVRAKVKEMDKINKYLDVADFSLIDDELLAIWVKQKERTVDELFDKISTDAKCADEVAVVEWIKRWVKGNEKLYIKDGIIYYRN